MGLYSTITQSGVGTTNWYPVNHIQPDFKIGMGAVVTGAATYTIQHTFDNIFDTNVTPTAFNHDAMVGLTVNEDGNYAFPIRAIRINQTAGAGSVALTIIQGD